MVENVHSIRGESHWLNLTLALLGHVPGVVHAFYVLLGSDPECGLPLPFKP
jgi:hypothetical protein